jgi:hypothetical protein
MNAPTPSHVAIETYGGNEYCRNRSTDSVPEGASFNEPRQSQNAVRCPLLDDTFFIDGAGI